jgi:hypothetical protein
MSVDMTALIAHIEEAIETAREALDDFRRAQNENSDEANEDHIQEATAALDAFEGHVGNLVP